MLFGKPKLLELTEIFMSIENKATVLDEDFSQTGLQLKEDVRNLEDPEALQEEFLSRGYDKNTWLEVVKYYNDGGTLPDADNTKRKVDKVEARLHKIYPEKYFLEEFETEEINELQSITSNISGECDGQNIPSSYGPKISKLEDLEAFVLDHSVFYSMINKTKKIKLEDQDKLSSRIEPLVKVLDEVEGELTVSGYDFLCDFMDSFSKTTDVSWKKPLELLDDVIRLREQEVIDVEIRYPNNLKSKVRECKGKNENYNIEQDLELIKCLNEFANKLNIERYIKNEKLRPYIDTKEEDGAIIKACADDYNKAAILTYDSDFKEDDYLKCIEMKTDSEIFPLLPSCAYSIFEPLAKEGYI